MTLADPPNDPAPAAPELDCAPDGLGPAPSLLVLLASIPGLFAGSQVGAILLAAYLGRDFVEMVESDDFPALIFDTAPFLVANAPIWVVLGLLAFGPVFLMGRSPVERLGLGRGRIDPLSAALLVAGTWGIAWVLEVALLAAGVEAGEFLHETVAFARAHPVAAVSMMTIGPAFCEELLYRGFVQRGLSAVWDPARAILLPAVIFGIAHFDPLQTPVAALLGAWFGYLAWRAGSIRIAIVGHLFNNALASGMLAAGMIDFELGSLLSAPYLATVVASGVCLGLGVRRLRAIPRPNIPQPI